jgi:aminoglycoside 6'-N-acetyltransferase
MIGRGNSARYRNLKFDPLEDKDLPVLYSWLQKPHIREFYHKKSLPDWEEMSADYRRRLSPDWPTRCYLSYAGLVPMGYIQAYRVADYPEYAAMIGEDQGISLDLFIGDLAFVGKGWGRLILLKFLNEIAFPLFQPEEICWIYHDKLNHRALSASRAAGFRSVRDFTEEGDLKELMALSRAEVMAIATSVSSR